MYSTCRMCNVDAVRVHDYNGPDEERIFHSISVDMSPYCISDSNEAKKKCSRAILDQLQSDGFALASSRNWGGKNTV